MAVIAVHGSQFFVGKIEHDIRQRYPHCDEQEDNGKPYSGASGAKKTHWEWIIKAMKNEKGICFMESSIHGFTRGASMS
jgi:hypothetical protein